VYRGYSIRKDGPDDCGVLLPIFQPSNNEPQNEFPLQKGLARHCYLLDGRIILEFFLPNNTGNAASFFGHHFTNLDMWPRHSRISNNHSNSTGEVQI
jgi:hypothetical protein